MNRNAKGLGFYLVIGVIILLLLMTFRGGLEASQTWNQKEYEEAWTNGEVAQGGHYAQSGGAYGNAAGGSHRRSGEIRKLRRM